MSLAALSLEPRPDGTSLKVRAQPGASRERIVGVHGDALKVAVTAAPEKGKANDAIRALLAQTLGVAPRDVVLTAGEAARDKRFLVRGVSAAVLRSRLVEAIPDAPG